MTAQIPETLDALIQLLTDVKAQYGGYIEVKYVSEKDMIDIAGEHYDFDDIVIFGGHTSLTNGDDNVEPRLIFVAS